MDIWHDWHVHVKQVKTTAPRTNLHGTDMEVDDVLPGTTCHGHLGQHGCVFAMCQSVPFLELLSTVKMNKADMYIDMFQIWYKNYISKAWKNWKIQASKHRWWRDWHFHLSRYLPRCWLESGKPVCRGKFAPVHRFGMLSTESTESTSSREWTDTGSQVNKVKWIINYCND